VTHLEKVQSTEQLYKLHRNMWLRAVEVEGGRLPITPQTPLATHNGAAVCVRREEVSVEVFVVG
jgi:hypothetical protein